MKNLIQEVLMSYVNEQREKWDEEILRQISSQYENLSDLLKKEPKAVKAMRNKGLYNELTLNMTRGMRKAYTYDEIESEAKKYGSMPEFQKGSPLYYNAAKYRRILDKFKSFLEPGLKRYTDEDLRTIASKYTDYMDFVRNEPSVYQLAYSRKILQDITKNMNKDRNPVSYEQAKKIVSNYSTLADFARENSKVYNGIRHREWFDELKKNLKVQNVWTKEEVGKLAQQYETNKEFRDNEPQAWSAAGRNGWMDELGKHFEKIGNKYKRLLYVYEFPDNHAYVGLTYSEKNRQSDHYNLSKGKTAVSKHIIKTNLKPVYKTLSEYIDSEEAANLEKCMIEEYRNRGWKMLNTHKGGGLGACKRSDLTVDAIKKLTEGFKSRKEFQISHPKEYYIAQRYGWLEDIFSGIPFLGRKKWIYEKTKEEAKKYKSRSEFSSGNQTAYRSAMKNGWIDEFFPEKYQGHSEKIKQSKRKI
jgi:hypothetical protein